MRIKDLFCTTCKRGLPFILVDSVQLCHERGQALHTWVVTENDDQHVVIRDQINDKEMILYADHNSMNEYNIVEIGE